ncbi:MAG: helix-turn-helix transcriptional regulator [Verrucomicrobia bacterium]|nr:helix-turn-helix transcriptional regulator [Verrucomicrobiota bacterium]
MDGVLPDPEKQRAFGKGVRACRERLELSKDEFAERIGISTRYLRKIESGLARPSSDVMLPILFCFETPDYAKLGEFFRACRPRRAAVLDRASPFVLAQLQ